MTAPLPDTCDGRGALRSEGALLPIEAGAAVAYGGAGTANPGRCACFLNQA